MIEHLELFIAVAKEKHFGRAAEVCNITQPTLSASIKQLECLLGVMLVERDSRFRRLTPEGEQVLTWARRILADTRAMQEEIRAAKRGLTGCVRIAVVPTALKMVARLTKPLLEKHPGVTFSVRASASSEIPSLLANFDIEAGITYLDTESDGHVVSIPLYAERYYLVTADGVLPKKLKAISWARAARLPLCLLSSDTRVRGLIDQHLARANARPVLESNSIQVLVSHISDDSWSSILPLNLARTSLTAAIRAIPLVEPDARRIVGLVAMRREPNTPLVAALLDEANRLSVAMNTADATVDINCEVTG
ncbi:LysR family transcriptional regulator [Hyphomicrobium sp.]|uniref:LysR family transcriptional regulator n=1 Tax=Hyphomicrobium sp. TaxID=82 RepID=UPI0025BE5A3F|nr:LysR family transcriptional regulator [Hyphomicrobium sp.]MCC7251924.1 LysR family transcriptional regulator [Hyphomicrobium sp.]